MSEENQYNKDLFNPKNFRGRLHIARYKWLDDMLKKYTEGPVSMIELGCFDGKTLEYLSQEPIKYEGYDANWDGGLELGKEKYKDRTNTTFHESSSPATFNPSNEVFDVVVSQETMEHLPTKDLDEYARKLAEAVGDDGYAFISVPNERGPVMVLKHLYKRYVHGHRGKSYTTSELFNGLIGNMDKVERVEGGHKGFSYKKLRKILEQYFDVVSIQGLPFNILGPGLSFTVAMVLKPKKKA